jgi:hypothetical protein
MVIIETEEELTKALEEINRGWAHVVPLMSDHQAHAAVNSLCVLYVDNGVEQYIFPFNHNDTINLTSEQQERIIFNGWTPTPGILRHLLPKLAAKLEDVDLTLRLSENKVVEAEQFYTPIMHRFYSMYRDVPNVNRIIPLMSLIQFLQEYTNKLMPRIHFFSFRHSYIDAPQKFHKEIVLPTLQFIEKSGLCVDTKLHYQQYFGTRNTVYGNLVYTQYNPYTITGRITNKFGGVNYSALSKDDGCRKAFVSRFPNGRLVLLDFESFHLRLMGKLIGWPLPKDESVHMWLAKQYFMTDNPTEEQYKQGKQWTFEYLYGKNHTQGIEFFRAIYEWMDVWWDKIQKEGYITSREGRRIELKHIENPSREKVFNYLLQLTEMEVSMRAIHQLLPLYEAATSKLVLYTYDSLLIDHNPDDKQLLKDTIEILQQNNEFPVRIYRGVNFHEMAEVQKHSLGMVCKYL